MVLFDVLAHQPVAIPALRRAFAGGRLAHAHLFWGPEGVGKTRAALALAQALFCTGSPAPCGECADCRRVPRLAHPDLHLVLPALRVEAGDPSAELETYARDLGACLRLPRLATIGIERVRGLKLESAKAGVERDRRVIVLREAERMTPEAAQAALKLIEEPRPGTFLLLTAADPSHLLPTIISRCQQLRFRPLPLDFIAGQVAERFSIEPGAARLVAGLAQGSLSRAVGLAELDATKLRNRALALFETPAPDAGQVARRVQALGAAWNPDLARITVDLMITWYGDLVAVRQGLTPDRLVHADRLGDLRAAAAGLSAGEIRRRIGLLEEMLEAIEQNVNPALALQATLLRIQRLIEEHPVL